MLRSHHRALVVSLILSTLLHAAAALILSLVTPPREQERFRVRLMPLPAMRPKRFRPIGVRSRGPEVRMERISPDPGRPRTFSLPPLYLPGVTLPKIQMPPPVSPGEDIAMELGAKPPAFEVEPARMTSPGALHGVPEERFDLALELLRLEDIERTGLKSFVVVDRADRRNILGYFHISRVGHQEGMGLTQFASELSHRTNLRVKAEDRSVDLRSGEIFEAPMLFLGRNLSSRGDTLLGVGIDTLRYVEGVEKQDIEFLVEYMLRGGLLVIPQLELYDQLRRYAERTRPGRMVFFDLPDDHPIFRSFYDIDIQSLYDLIQNAEMNKPAPVRGPLPPQLRGIEVDKRLAGVAPLSVPTPADTSLYVPMLKLSTNMVTFALSQPGGLGYAYFQPSQPERSYAHETTALLALLRGSSADSLSLNEVSVFLDEERLNSPAPSGGGEGDALIFHHLRGGKRRLRLQYGTQRKDMEILLKGDRVVTVTLGTHRFLWITRLWARIDGADEPYANWQARHARLKVKHIGAAAAVTMESQHPVEGE